jgi:hypothetical protein
MDDELVKIAGGLYSKADAEAIEVWVELASTLLLFDHSKVEELKLATRSVGAKAQAQYPQLESGEPVTLDVADAEDHLAAFPTDTHLGFVVITGEALFTCIDGPNAGAVVLCDMLDLMHKSMTGGGEL